MRRHSSRNFVTSIGAGLIAGAAVSWLMQQTPAQALALQPAAKQLPAPELRTERLVITDADNHEMAIFTHSDSGRPYLEFRDRRGVQRIRLGMGDKTAPALTFNNTDGVALVNMSMGDNEATITILNGKSKQVWHAP